jgi:hypothetical protein
LGIINIRIVKNTFFFKIIFKKHRINIANRLKSKIIAKIHKMYSLHEFINVNYSIKIKLMKENHAINNIIIMKSKKMQLIL